MLQTLFSLLSCSLLILYSVPFNSIFNVHMQENKATFDHLSKMKSTVVQTLGTYAERVY